MGDTDTYSLQPIVVKVSGAYSIHPADVIGGRFQYINPPINGLSEDIELCSFGITYSRIHGHVVSENWLFSDDELMTLLAYPYYCSSIEGCSSASPAGFIERGPSLL
ncbi:hypothetical protein CRG98_004161 [Punica granatum]|uniref:Uncharacterized protein n=1 Tax=Punica granatum TaxID=22663 RepID=A0A2I0L459_PUNGR|nr:hypothetical protein CRG98_004161 [Punica granatum]